MEYRIKDYTIKGQRILLPRQTSIEDLRLIFNETQKKLICSTATKDNVTLVQGEGGTLVEVPTSICSLNSTDLLTIKCDYGDNLEEVKEAVENIDLASIERKVETESQAIQSAIQNVDLSSVESKVDEVKQAVENIQLPEIDTTNIASKDLERFFGVKPIEGYEFMTAEEVCSTLEDIMTAMDLALTPQQAQEITNNTLTN